MITHQELIETLTYDPETGIFRWAKPRPKIQVGQIAGYLHHKGYINMEINGKHYSAHRLAWFYITGENSKKQIDHINRCRSDNRISNLREATHGQNRANSKCFNKNGYKGVTKHKWLKEKPFAAQITFNKKVIYLGCYPTAEEAHSAYCRAAKKMHGDFFNP